MIRGFLNRLSETQYKCSQGDPFENAGGGGTVGVGCRAYLTGAPYTHCAGGELFVYCFDSLICFVWWVQLGAQWFAVFVSMKQKRPTFISSMTIQF